MTIEKTDFNNVRMMNIDLFCQYVSLGKTKARAWGKEIGAKKYIGKSVVYDKEIIDKALAEL